MADVTKPMLFDGSEKTWRLKSPWSSRIKRTTEEMVTL